MWAIHRSTHQFGIVAGALSNESSHASPVRDRPAAGTMWATHECTKQIGIVAGDLGNESPHSSPVIGRACIMWAIH